MVINISLLIFLHSLQTDESLDWHRHGNTGGLRAESEVEKVLRVVHNFIKTNSKSYGSLTVFLLDRTPIINYHLPMMLSLQSDHTLFWHSFCLSYFVVTKS